MRKILILMTGACVTNMLFAFSAHASQLASPQLIVSKTQFEVSKDDFEIPSAHVLQPVKNSADEKLLIIVPGMLKSAREYENLGKEIQKSSSSRLWVAILKFTNNFVNPVQMSSGVENVFASVRENGFTEASPENTMIAGHSLGGIIAQYYVNKKNFAGLILLSSYLVRAEGSSSLPQAELPVLTLSGELDGQTRITRVAFDAKSLVNPTVPVKSIEKKPVIVLPKINHAQFAGGEQSKADLRPEVEYLQAQQEIASVVSDFMIANNTHEFKTEESVDATLRLAHAVSNTRTMLSPYWAAQTKDQQWCEESQRSSLSALPISAKIEINHTVHENKTSFARSKPKAEVNNNGSVFISIDSMMSYHPNVIDRSTIPESAQTLACKNKSSESISQLLGLGTSTHENCSELNSRAYNWALDQVSTEVRERFLRRGRQLEFASDKIVASGLQWLPARVDFENQSDTRRTIVTSVGMKTKLNAPLGLAGMHYCKLLSPTRAMEWILVDGLRD